MPELATREFWKNLQPIPDCLESDVEPRVYLRNALIEDGHLYAPFTETTKPRPLQIPSSESRQCDVLMATNAGLTSRHYHLYEVFAYIIGGKWGYPEHDWIVAADDFVCETPDEGHTLMAYEYGQLMRAFFIVKGPLTWLDERGNADDTFDVHDYIAMCHAYYDKIDAGAIYIDSLLR